jgi:hypothetical protein
LLEPHIEGVEVWYVSPYVSDVSCFQMALTPCSRCCGEFAANVYALYANSFVVERSDVLFQGGLLGGNSI